MERFEFENAVVGAQLVKLDADGLVVRKNDKTIRFDYHDDYGDCCGYNKFEAMVVGDDVSRNPVITAVEWEDNKTGPYEQDSETLRIRFLGEHKLIGQMSAESGSGSGYAYGACCWLECGVDTLMLTKW